MNGSIEKRYQNLKEKIAKIASSVNKSADEIKLVAVSKTQDISRIIEAQKAGLVYFGENKVQELKQKMNFAEYDITWHFIGHLQTNKVKYIIDKVSLIHSVDSVRLAEKISQLSVRKNIKTEILLQLNTSEEESKFGFSVETASESIEAISKLPNLYLKGLMTMAPYTNEINRISACFSKLRNFAGDIANRNIKNVDMKYLSMGMSHDFEIAIKEGSNMLRIGTLIFGARN